jgi:hypothetical protein
MAFLIRLFGAGQQFTIVAKVPFRLELIGIVTEYRSVMIAMPRIGYACRAFRNEHALIPAIFCRFVRDPERESGSPAKNLSDDCPQVRKTWCVSKCRETCTADDGIKFILRSALHLREGYHRSCPPHQCGRRRFKTSTTATRLEFLVFRLKEIDYILHLRSEKRHFPFR